MVSLNWVSLNARKSDSYRLVIFSSTTSSQLSASWATKRPSARSMQSGRQLTFTIVSRMANSRMLVRWTAKAKKTSWRPTWTQVPVVLAGICLQLLRMFPAHRQNSSSRWFQRHRSLSQAMMRRLSIPCRCQIHQRILSQSIPAALFHTNRIQLKAQTTMTQPSQSRHHRELLKKSQRLRNSANLLQVH